MRTIGLFLAGVLAMHPIWQFWVALLFALNFVVPWFLLDRVEAVAVLAVAAASGAWMLYLVHRTGFTRLLGLGHILWLPLVVWLWSRIEAVPMAVGFDWWLRAVALVNALSLVIDAVDVLRWLRGERAPLVRTGDR